MKRTGMSRRILLALVVLMAGWSGLRAQENVWEDLLKQEVEVANPVYKPVVGFGIGVLNFYGDVRNSPNSLLTGNVGYKVNVTTFIDKQHFFKGDFFLIAGSLTGNEHSNTNLVHNLNFQSDLMTFGVDVNYSFRHILKKETILRPYIAIGIENIQFNPKGDLKDAEVNPYFYWPDGSVRNLAYPDPLAQVTQRDYIYETDLRKADLYNKGSYSLNSFAIPIDAGLEFNVSPRVTLRLGMSLHYAFTDNIDNLSGDKNINVNDGINYGGKVGNDIFTFSYATLHLDLFSDAKTKMVERLFAMVDNFDYTLLDDEDNDGVPDGIDNCPGTPKSVEVDSVGCPYDDDGDGVPNYMDKQLNTPQGAIVDVNGVEITDEQVAEVLDADAMKHSEVALYRMMYLGNTGKRVTKGIPAKFKFLDTDKDGYLSFEEVLSAIDAFFDYQSSLTVEDLYELNDFFFSQ